MVKFSEKVNYKKNVTKNNTNEKRIRSSISHKRKCKEDRNKGNMKLRSQTNNKRYEYVDIAK